MKIVAVALSIALASCASTPALDQDSRVVNVSTALPKPALDDIESSFDEYRLGPTDNIAVSVFNAPELAATGQIDRSGNFLLPLVGSIKASGKTPEQLASDISDQLRGRYIKNPQVAVNVVEAKAHTVTIDGAVNSPGIYPIAGQMTLQRAIATARGLSDIAKPDRVVVFRRVDGQQMAAMFDLNDVRAGRVEDPSIYGNDIVIVGEDGVRRFLNNFSQVPILSRFVPIP